MSGVQTREPASLGLIDFGWVGCDYPVWIQQLVILMGIPTRLVDFSGTVQVIDSP